MSDVGLDPSEAWEHGKFCGAEDAVQFLDWRAQVRGKGPGVHLRPRPRSTPNPWPRLTMEHSDWADGYQHGWHGEIDRDNHRKGP